MIKTMKAVIIDNDDMQCDLIVGHKQLKKIGLTVDCDKQEMTWIDKVTKFHPIKWTSNALAMRHSLAAELHRVTQVAEANSAEIAPANHCRADIDEVCDGLTCLTPQQCNESRTVMKKHEEMFSSKVGMFHHEFEPDADETVEPHCHKRPHAVPANQLDLVKGELDRQEAEGIMAKAFEATAWYLPMFVHPKKDGTT